MPFLAFVRDEWTCRTFAHCPAPELKADFGDVIQEKRMCTENQCLN